MKNDKEIYLFYLALFLKKLVLVTPWYDEGHKEAIIEISNAFWKVKLSTALQAKGKTLFLEGPAFLLCCSCCRSFL